MYTFVTADKKLRYVTFESRNFAVAMYVSLERKISAIHWAETALNSLCSALSKKKNSFYSKKEKL